MFDTQNDRYLPSVISAKSTSLLYCLREKLARFSSDVCVARGFSKYSATLPVFMSTSAELNEMPYPVSSGLMHAGSACRMMS